MEYARCHNFSKIINLFQNTKLSLTKNGFQKGALNVAKNRKIGLWRITANDNHEVIFNRTINRIKGGVSKSMLTLNEAIIDVKKG
ncbi:hypothetical protein MSC41_02945 [Acinetobacter baumannii]|nr:hypothetical protein [Acinetobacter baumannii]MDV4294634.1 hypothetical protein [Acinetobacter baumannii]